MHTDSHTVNTQLIFQAGLTIYIQITLYTFELHVVHMPKFNFAAGDAIILPINICHFACHLTLLVKFRHRNYLV